MSKIDDYHRGDLYFQLLTKTSEDCVEAPTVTIDAPPGTIIVGGGACVDWQSPPCSPRCPVGNMLTAMYPKTNTKWTVASKDIQGNKARITAYCIVVRMRPTANYTIVTATSMNNVKTAQANLPVGFTIVGGGARALGINNMLVGSYPVTGLTGWVATASSGPVTVWAIGLKKSLLIANGVTIGLQDWTTPPANRPKKTLVIPNFYLTGVGAKVKTMGLPDSLLTASFPQDRQTVVAEGKDSIVPNLASVTAYAVGFL